MNNPMIYSGDQFLCHRNCTCRKCRAIDRNTDRRLASYRETRKSERALAAHCANRIASRYEMEDEVDLLARLNLPAPDGSTGIMLDPTKVENVIVSSNGRVRRERSGLSVREAQALLSGGHGFGVNDEESYYELKNESEVRNHDRNQRISSNFEQEIRRQRKAVAATSGPDSQKKVDNDVVRVQKQLAFLKSRGYRTASMNPYDVVNALTKEGYYGEGEIDSQTMIAPTATQRMASTLGIEESLLPPFGVDEVTKKQVVRYLTSKGQRTIGASDSQLWTRFCEAWAVESLVESQEDAPKRRRQRS